MSDVDFVDKNGMLPTLAEVEEMIAVITKFMRPEHMLALPPELAVNLPAIRRHLILLQAVLVMKDKPA